MTPETSRLIGGLMYFVGTDTELRMEIQSGVASGAIREIADLPEAARNLILEHQRDLKPSDDQRDQARSGVR